VDDPTRTFDFSSVTRECVARAVGAMDAMHLDEALAQGRAIVREVDEFISYAAPFTLAKKVDEIEHGDKALATILYSCAEALRIASLLFSPVCPGKMARFWRNWNCSPLNDPADPDSGFKAPLEALSDWGGAWSLQAGQKIEKGEALFMRADVKQDPPG